MREDRPPVGDVDGDIAALFQTMKGDEPPADLEQRLLAGLAATAAVSAVGAAAAKVGFGQKLLSILGGSALVKSVLVGGACGIIVCGVWVIADPAPPPISTAPSTHGSGAALAPAASAKVADPAPNAGPVASSSSSVAAPGSTLGSPLSTWSTNVNGGQGGAQNVSDKGTPAPEPPNSTAPTVAPVPVRDADALQRELGEVRAIAGLVDSGNCAGAREKIALYFTNHPNGQLAGEVHALAARCNGGASTKP
ncbi:MAG: hypothetical protein IPK82_26310 [Polyangiaceae bacterium]|nr:hypothetical protein [Polyangiaceae bacterium]